MTTNFYWGWFPVQNTRDSEHGVLCKAEDSIKST